MAISGSVTAGTSIDHEHDMTLPDGHVVTATLRRPQPDDAGPRPAIVVLGGFDGAARVLDTVPTDAPVVLASFPYPWDAPERLTLRGLPSTLRSFRLGVDRSFAAQDALVALLRAQADVDPERVILVGASAGAPFVTIGASGVTANALIIVQGFGDLPRTIARQFDLSLEQKRGPWLRPFTAIFSRMLVWWLDLPAPEHHARDLHAGMPVLMVTADGDERVPQHATQTLWRALQKSDAAVTRIDRPGGHLRGFGDPEITAILQEALDWLVQGGLLPQAD